MEVELGYDELFAKYAELQLRVTRFSSTEQELINARDRLDQELLLYKKLSDFNTEALKTSSKVEFLQKVVETIIDIFETEIGIIHYTSKSGLFEDKFFIEGARKSEHQHLLEDLCALPALENESKEVTIYSFISENIQASSLIDSCLVSSKIEMLGG